MEGIGGNITSVKARQIALTPKNITLTPEWKLDAEELVSELTTLRKRVTALESLKESNELDREIYDEMLAAQKAGYLDKVKSAAGLADSIKARLGSVTGQISSLTKYLVNAKLDHKSGNLDEPSLKLARDSIEPSLHPLISEKNDLAASLKNLETVLPSHFALS